MSGLPKFEVIKEHEFDEQLHALFDDFEAADEFTAGAEALLAVDPRAGLPASSDESVWYLPMAPVHGKRVSIFYTFDAETVLLMSIVAFED